MATQPSEGSWRGGQFLRSQVSTFFGVLFGILALLTLAGLAIASGVLDRIEYGIVFVGALLISARGFRIGVAQTDRELKFRTLQWTYTFRRSDVVRLTAVDHPVKFRPGAIRSFLAVDLTNGDTRIFWPVGRSGMGSGSADEIATQAHQLNRNWGIGRG